MNVKSMDEALELVKGGKQTKVYFCKDERIKELEEKGYKVAKNNNKAIKVVTTGDSLNLMIK